MAKKPTIITLTSSYGSQTAINTSLTNIQNQFDNTLSRDGSAPNNMQADLDMDGNDILNVNSIDTEALRINNIAVTVDNLVASPTAANIITITDVGGFYISTNVENALQELVGGSIIHSSDNNFTVDGYLNLDDQVYGLTKTQFQTLSIPAAVTKIVTTGFAAVNDFGAASYKKVGSSPPHNGKFQTVDGAWWELNMPYATPEMFGAKGDDPGNGTGTDDRAAFQDAMDYSRRLILPRNATYRINGTLQVPRFQQIVGMGTRSNTDILTSEQTGATRLIFTGTGSACFVNKDTANLQSHGCMKGFIIRCLGTYTYMVDFRSALDWLFMHLGMETPNLTTGGIRSIKIGDGTGPSWVNKMYDVSIRLPDTNNLYAVNVDWSDSVVESCQFTGGVGCVDNGFGVRWLNNQIERSQYAGLTLNKLTNVKTTMIIGNQFDINNEHAIVFVANDDPTTNRVFNTIVASNIFRTADPNTSVAGASSIALINTTGASYRIGPVTGNQEMHPTVPQFVEVGTWTKPSNTGNLQA